MTVFKTRAKLINGISNQQETAILALLSNMTLKSLTKLGLKLLLTEKLKPIHLKPKILT
jgi:hypothetical protein